MEPAIPRQKEPAAEALTLRSAAGRDIDAVLELWREAGSGPAVTDTPDGVHRLLGGDPEALILAELDGVIVGSLIAAWDGWRGSFYRLAVCPAHRRRGIATALLAEGERRLHRRGAVRLTAIVASDEEGAIAFWSGARYVRQASRTRFIRHLDHV